MQIDNHDEDFDCVAGCAVRYCMGRRTYMPGLVLEWIMRNCDGKFSTRTLDVLKRDIDNESMYTLGDICDIPVWQKFRAWLDEQKGRE